MAISMSPSFAHRGAASMQRQHQRVLVQFHAQCSDGLADEARIRRGSGPRPPDVATLQHFQFGTKWVMVSPRCSRKENRLRAEP